MIPCTSQFNTSLELNDLAHAPLSVAILLNVVLALAKGVPKLDCPVARARDDLPVVRAEADGQDVGGMSDKAAGRRAGVQVPEAEGVVPG